MPSPTWAITSSTTTGSPSCARVATAEPVKSATAPRMGAKNFNFIIYISSLGYSGKPILTVSLDLEQHATSHGQDLVTLFVSQRHPQNSAGCKGCTLPGAHQLQQFFGRHSGLFGQLNGDSFTDPVNRNDPDQFGRLPQPRISKQVHDRFRNFPVTIFRLGADSCQRVLVRG